MDQRSKNKWIAAIAVGILSTVIDFGYHWFFATISPLGYWVLKFALGAVMTISVIELYEKWHIAKKYRAPTIALTAGGLFTLLLTNTKITSLLGLGYYTNYAFPMHLVHIAAFFIAAWLVLNKTQWGRMI